MLQFHYIRRKEKFKGMVITITTMEDQSQRKKKAPPPAEFLFLVRPISFSGPYCQANIVFQLDGTIIAPTDSQPWGKGILQWLEFIKLRGITV